MSHSGILARATLAAAIGLVGLTAAAPFASRAEASASRLRFAPAPSRASAASRVPKPTKSNPIKYFVDPHPTPPTPCVASPRSCGYPDASTTGVPAGLKLTASPSVTVTTPGAVLSGLDVHGTIQVRANGVTIKDSRISCAAGCTGHFAIEIRPGVTGTVIHDVEASGSSSVAAVIGGDGPYTLTRGNIHDATDGLHVVTGTTVQDSFVHDLAPTMTSHDDAIQQIPVTSDGITIVHNTLLPFSATTHAYNNSAFICGSQCLATTNMTFTDNLMNGGNHTLYCPDHGIANNVFARNRFSNEYRYSTTVNCKAMPGTSFDRTNVMDGTNAAI